MKKCLVFAVILAMLVPAAAFAKAEFSLGGYIKLDAFFDTTQEGKNMNTGFARDNDGLNHHGRTHFTSQSSRFNFTIKGPKVFGAQTTGFFEMDMDAAEAGISTNANSASNSYTPRLRHAMFRFNWPETELLFGQYWSMFCENYPELAEDGPFQGTGAPTARIPQVRLTQKFLGWGTAAVLIGDANGVSNGQSYSANDRTGGESAFAPQIQGKLQYDQDLWGKAAYYGKPTPFRAKVTAGWQRSFIEELSRTLKTFGQDNYSANFNAFTNHQVVNPWIVMGSLFIPVLPTHSANLAGTASLMTQWWIGQGVGAFGFTGDNTLFKFIRNPRGQAVYEAELQTRFGGEVQGQYYFTNQWFLTAAYGLSRTIGVGGQDRAAFGGNQYAILSTADLLRTWQQAEVVLWYRPVQAIKFGLEYAYGYNQYFQITTVPGPGDTSSVGNAHRVEFVGFFYF
jgi:hypothetical protein